MLRINSIPSIAAVALPILIEYAATKLLDYYFRSDKMSETFFLAGITMYAKIKLSQIASK